MKPQSTSIKVRIAITSALTASFSLLVPTSAMADEKVIESEQKSGIVNNVEAKPFMEHFGQTAPLFQSLAQGKVTASPDAVVSFDRVGVTSLPNPQIEIDRLAKVEAEKKEKEANEKAEKEKKEAEERRLEAEQVNSLSSVASLEYPHFMPSGIEPMSEIDERIVDIAATGLGKPYVWGGTTPDGWDCSGYVQWVYKQAGINIPRVNQWEAGKVTTNPVPGDIVVQNGQSHVGIYVGGGMMYSAMNPTDGTKFHPVNIYPSYFVHIER